MPSNPPPSLNHSFILWLARGFGSGLLPKGPGTWGSLVGLAWWWILASFPNSSGRWTVAAASTLLAVWICSKAESILQRHDPSEVVIDEIVALPFCFLFLPNSFGTLPLTGVSWEWWCAAFLLFRILDIVKPPPIRQLQRLPRGWGIVADDVAAGLVTGLLLRLAWQWRHG